MNTKRSYGFDIIDSKIVESIHGASLELLSKTGVTVGDEEARELLSGHGCVIIDERVRIPEALVQKIVGCPVPPARIYSRHENLKILEGNKKFMAHNFGSVNRIIDSNTGILRDCTTMDLIKTTQLLDSIEEIDAVLPLVYPQDIRQEVVQIRMLEAGLKYSGKPLVSPGVVGSAVTSYLIEMLSLIAGGRQKLRERPLAYVLISPASPLKLHKEICLAISTAASAGCPIIALPCPISGLTSPITLAGSLVQQNSEVLAFTVLARLINPTVPIVYGARLMFMDMRNCNVAFGIPNTGIAGACAVEMAHLYGMESDIYGLSTSSKSSDCTCGYEKAFNGILTALTGTDWMSGSGMLDDARVTSFEQLIIDNDILKMLRCILKNFSFDRERMGLKAIADVMDGQSFITHEHTMDYIRSDEVYDFSSVLRNTAGMNQRVETCCPTTWNFAHDKVQKILALEPTTYITQAQNESIDDIVKEAEIKFIEIS